MLLIEMIVAFTCIFLAGMHYAVYDNFLDDDKRSLYWSIGLSLLGVWNLINIVGYVRLHS